MAKSKAERGRFSSRKKMDVVLRVLRGYDLDLVSREAGITAAMVLLLLPTWGCVAAGDPELTGVYQTWDSVIERWIGKSKPDLILELGPPQFNKEAGDGAEELVWDMTVPSMSGLAETYNTLPLYGGVDCRLLFLADVDGIIRSGKREGCN